jgi:hypothetical protein
MVVAVVPDNMKYLNAAVSQIFDKAIPGFIEKGKTAVTKLFSMTVEKLLALTCRPNNATNIGRHFDVRTQGL